MQRSINPSIILHALACTIIALMLAYIFREKKGDKLTLLCAVLQQHVEKANMVLKANNEAYSRQIKVMAGCYPSMESEKYAQRTDSLQQSKDSLFQFLDQAKTSGSGLASIKQACNAYLGKTKFYIDYKESSVEALNLLAFNDSLGSKYSALWSQSPEYQNLMVSFFQNNIHKNTKVVLNYFASKVGGPGCGFGTFNPSISIKNLNFTDPDQNYLEAEVLLGWSELCGTVSANYYKLFIDGKEHPVDPYGETPFRKVYTQSGIHPMRVKAEIFNCMADSPFVFEKTYFIRVQ